MQSPVVNRLVRWSTRLALGGGVALLVACASAPGASLQRLDNTPRIALISAFEPEVVELLPQVRNPRQHRIHGVDFTTGTLAGKDVVLFLSGISMTNAAMNTQRVLDHFNVSHIVYSGIAGGVNPNLHIGDVVVAEQWGQYLEVLMARETTPGAHVAPDWMQAELTLPAFGMMYPRPVEVRSAARPAIHKQFWFPVDARMLAVAKGLTNVTLARCLGQQCLNTAPRVQVGGNGVSGQAFVDNKVFREYAFNTFGTHVLDMETAATAMVAHSNGVPYIAFRSLSDLAGGGDGANEMTTFMGLAAANSAQVLVAFLSAWR